jgi:hypothetical protein
LLLRFCIAAPKRFAPTFANDGTKCLLPDNSSQAANFVHPAVSRRPGLSMILMRPRLGAQATDFWPILLSLGVPAWLAILIIIQL